MTYDRRIIKVDTTRARALADRLYGRDEVFRFILPSGEQDDSIPWKYTLEPPGPGWHAEDFADTAWQTGVAGFGYRGWQPYLNNGCPWDTNVIWLRRDFNLEQPPQGKLYLNLISCHTVSTVYVNGRKLAVFKPTENFHQMMDFSTDLHQLLRTGQNTIAVQGYSKDAPADRNSGRKRQFIDVGIIEVLNDDPHGNPHPPGHDQCRRLLQHRY
jgi:hypothetical protein